ncbi:hypothetical protein L1987_19154 [Smallanthus sonchifolius]|uniref:Uncharacterized protein n=1 Tax=Smallanthus sonchifolius TaxID=185202 RepID=A0ACB9J2H7_9ASTR|nr:hypothetical protein L1987_19154 [Smallanthus sonchifolius]
MPNVFVNTSFLQYPNARSKYTVQIQATLEASIMEKTGVLNFKVGQVAEMRTFETGFRGAWFRCKIHDFVLKKNKILLEYFDYDLEEKSWVKIYQVPPFGRKPKHIKKQLMVRPQYLVLYHKNEMPPVISQTCVIYGTWKVGNLVDWFKDDCFWSARIVKELSDDKVQIELPMPPSGEGKEGEEGKHEAFCKDLRPSLDWSETKGWTFATVEGQTPCDAQLFFPTEQGMDSEVEHAAAAAASSPVNASSTTRASAEGDREQENEKNVKMDLDVEHAVAKAAGSPVNASSSARIPAEGDRNEKNVKVDFEVDQHAVATAAGSPVNASSSTRIPGEGDKNEKSVKADFEVDQHAVETTAGSPVNASSSTRIPTEGDRDRESEQNEKNVKVNCDLLVESSESSSSLHVGKRKAAERRELNIMHEDTLEAAIIDLEELVNKVEWLQRLLHNDATTSSTWKFA